MHIRSWTNCRLKYCLPQSWKKFPFELPLGSVFISLVLRVQVTFTLKLGEMAMLESPKDTKGSIALNTRERESIGVANGP